MSKVLSQHLIGHGVFAERIGSHKWQLFNWTTGEITARTWPTMKAAVNSYHQDAWSTLMWRPIRSAS